MPSFEGLVSLKRKKYWVTRWIEITSNIFQYRNKKDSDIKRQYKIEDCFIWLEQDDKSVLITSQNEQVQIKVDSNYKYEQIAKALGKTLDSKQTEIEKEQQQTLLAYNKSQQEIIFWKQIDQNQDKREFLQHYDDVQYARLQFEALLIEQISFFNLQEKFKFFTEVKEIGEDTILQTGGEAIINCNKKQIFDIINNKSKYDNFIAEESIIKELNQELKIVQNTIKLAFPQQNNQLIFLRRIYEENENILLVDKSLEVIDGIELENSLFKVLVSGWKLRQFANGSTLVSFASQIQFKGTLDQPNKLFKNYIYEQKYSSEQAKWLPRIAELVQN